MDALNLPDLDLVPLAMDPLNDPLHLQVNRHGPRILVAASSHTPAPTTRQSLEDAAGTLTHLLAGDPELVPDQRINIYARLLPLRTKPESDILNVLRRLRLLGRQLLNPFDHHSCDYPVATTGSLIGS
jgi:hypothetical protein